jgi:UDP-glucose 4-epimerase
MFRVKYRFISQRAGDRSDSTTLNINAKKILGFKAKKDIKTYIKNFIAIN